MSERVIHDLREAIDLPLGSVVTGPDGLSHQKVEGGWLSPDDDGIQRVWLTPGWDYPMTARLPGRSNQ